MAPLPVPKILEIFGLVTEYEVQRAYNTNTIKTLVMEERKRFLKHCNDDLIIPVRDRQPTKDGVGMETHDKDNETVGMDTKPDGMQINPVVQGPALDPLDVCFCFCDEPHMDITCLKHCCKQLVHHECLLSWLEFESSCCYCSKPIADITKVLSYPTIDWCKELPKTPNLTPRKRSPGKLRDAQQMEINAVYGSPPHMRLADQVRSILQEKKRLGQIDQASNMVRTRGDDIKKKGAGLGAVVTVIPNPRAVSHSVGIVGIIYRRKSMGGAQVATSAGLLVQSSKKDFWIPDDQYVVRYKPDEDAAIPPELQKIRESINDGTYNTTNKVKRSTIQEVHKLLTDQVSPQKMGKYYCLKGKCNPKHCGCAVHERKCTSACICNGNCTNPNNGK